MTLQAQITFRDMVPLPSLEAEIRQRVDKLQQWTPDVMSCHVAVSAAGNRHHQGHDYAVHVSVHLRGAEVVASTNQHDQDIHRAMRGAFDAVDRQLEDHARRRRGQVKQHGPSAKRLDTEGETGVD